MPIRKYNYRLVKIHRNYTVKEAAELFGVHKNTVRDWIRRGLPTIADDRRPALILGRSLVEFLKKQRAASKCPCKAGQIYCVRCRCAIHPAGGAVSYVPSSETLGSLVGRCPACNSRVYRRVNHARLTEAAGDLEVRLPKG